jgi:hypothetical protein
MGDVNVVNKNIGRNQEKYWEESIKILGGINKNIGRNQ